MLFVDLFVRERTLQEAVEVRKAGIHLSVIGVGSSIRPAELKGIATDPDDKNVYTVKDFNALTGIIETLLNDVCNGEFISVEQFNVWYRRKGVEFI